MDARETCLCLLSAESEAEVQTVIDATPVMASGDSSRPLDRRETNFNVTSNQASDVGEWVDGIEATFAEQVLPIDAMVARLWGELSAGRSLPVIDT